MSLKYLKKIFRTKSKPGSCASELYYYLPGIKRVYGIMRIPCSKKRNNAYCLYSVVRRKITLANLPRICKVLLYTRTSAMDFLFENNPEDLDLFYKTNLDFFRSF